MTANDIVEARGDREWQDGDDTDLYDAGYAEGVRDAVAYLAEVYGDEVYDTDVFDRLNVDREG